MKKNYEKPQIRFESFELSQSISVGCEFIATMAEKACELLEEETGLAVYIDGVCAYTPPGITEDQVCYHGPSDDGYVVYSS